MPLPKLTRDGANAATLGALILAIATTIAIIANTWQPAAIGALWALTFLIAGQLADRTRPRP